MIFFMSIPGNSTSFFLINPWDFHMLCSNLCYNRFWYNRESALSTFFMLPMGYSWKYIYRQGGWEYTFLKKPPGIFRFVTLTLEIPKKKSFYPWKFCKIVWHLLEVSRPKSKTHGHGNSHDFFMNTPGNSNSFLIKSWNFHLLLLFFLE